MRSPMKYCDGERPVARLNIRLKWYSLSSTTCASAARLNSSASRSFITPMTLRSL